MQRVDLGHAKLAPNFIGSWDLEPLDLCDVIVSYFESNPDKHALGRTDNGLNDLVKRSIDLSLQPNEIKLPGNEIFIKYFEALFACYKDYLLQWPHLTIFANKVEIGGFNIQRYQAGEHFQQIHCERSSLATLHRIFAWMTYLNDVADGGATSFAHYDLEIQPRKGLTLIWPAEWTHAHKGNVVFSGSKYIITGWIDLCNPN